MQLRNKRKIGTIIVMEAILMAVVLLVGLSHKRGLSEVPVDLSACTANQGYHYEDGAWVVTQDQLDENNFLVGADASDSTIINLTSDKFRLPKGDYTLTINYNNTVNQKAKLVTSENYRHLLRAEEFILSKNYNVVTYHFTATETIPALRVQVGYNNYGTASISAITIQPNSNGLKRSLLACLLLCIVVNYLLLRKEWIRSHRTRLMIMGSVVVMLSVPLCAYGITGGHDLMFHLMRIEGIAQELHYHQFPVRMSSAWLDGYGYPVSVYYGDALLYIPAIFRLFGFSVITSYKMFIVLMNLATVWMAYSCFRGIFKDYKVAVVASVGYSIAPYRFSCMYARHAVGEYSAMLFFPLIALAMYRIYTDENADRRRYRVDAVLLAAGMIGLLVTHTLSVEMTTVLLLLVAIVFIKRTLTWRVMRTLLQAVILTVLGGAFFWIPFVDYYASVDAQINSDVAKGGFDLIQWGGAYIADYFNVFGTPYGWNSEYLHERMALTPGLMLMVGLLLALGFVFKGKASKETKMCVGFSLLGLWLASNLFPWDFLTLHVWKGFSVVQFPWRFLGPSNLFLSLTLGCLLIQMKELPRGKELLDLEPEDATWSKTQNRVENRRHRSSVTWFLVCGALSMIVFLQHYASYDYVVNYVDTAELENWAVTSFFLREDTLEQQVPKGLMQNENIVSYEQLMNEGCNKKFRVVAGEGGGTVELPIFNYKGWHVVDADGKDYALKDGTQDLIAVSLPDGFDGELLAYFQEPWYWQVAEVISLLTILLSAWTVHWKRHYEL